MRGTGGTDLKKLHEYGDLIRFIQQFQQRSFIERVTQASINLPSEQHNRNWLTTPPWTLAGIARAAIIFGDPQKRFKANSKDVEFASAIFNTITPPHDDQDPALAFKILARHSFEQFPYQESLFADVSRAYAFFTEYAGEQQLTTVTQANLEELLGAPLLDVAGTALTLMSSAKSYGGFFDMKWLDQEDIRRVLEFVPRESIESAISNVFSATIDQFRESASLTRIHIDNRYAFNPLSSRPMLDWGGGKYIIPVPSLLGRRLSPIEYYFPGFEKWGRPFWNDLGYLFEYYVGRQLNLIRSSVVKPEIKYESRDGEKKSVDWIVELPDLVLLVEAKATRVPEGARAGDDSLLPILNRTIGHALQQINLSHKLIQTRHEAFLDIPDNKPMMGIVATLDSWHWAPTQFGRSFLPDCDIPYIVASIREIEELATIGTKFPLDKVLKDIDLEGMGDWHLANSLSRYLQSVNTHNPILQAAWDKAPVSKI